MAAAGGVGDEPRVPRLCATHRPVAPTQSVRLAPCTTCSLDRLAPRCGGGLPPPRGVKSCSSTHAKDRYRAAGEIRNLGSLGIDRPGGSTRREEVSRACTTLDYFLALFVRRSDHYARVGHREEKRSREGAE